MRSIVMQECDRAVSSALRRPCHTASNPKRMIAALSSNATCVCRDATGLPAPPAGRPNQEGQRGKLPRGPSDRQNRWAQDGPLDNVPPGKEQWGKPGNGMSFVLFAIVLLSGLLSRKGTSGQAYCQWGKPDGGMLIVDCCNIEK